MGWGGARVGSGQKPKGERAIKARKSSTPAPFVSFDGGRADDAVSMGPPDDLPDDQRDFWARNAPRAIAQGTLTKRTEETFRLLCEMDSERRETKKTIDRDGRTFIKVTVDGSGQEHQELKAHPLKSDYARLCKSVETLMARFKLAPFGKAEIQTKSKAAAAAANPWTKVSSGQ